MFHFIIIACALAAWLFGCFQPISTRLMYNQQAETADYLHMIITMSTLIVPLAYFYCSGNATYFLSGFAFAYIISTLCSFCMAIILAPYIVQALSTKIPSLYPIFIFTPSTIAILSVGIFLKNPFVIGAACAIASSCIGYLVKLDD